MAPMMPTVLKVAHLAALFYHLDRAHHVVVLVVQNVAMPHKAGPCGGIEGEITHGLGFPHNNDASDVTGQRQHDVFPPQLIHRRRLRRPREARPGGLQGGVEDLAFAGRVRRVVERLLVQRLELDEMDVHGMRVGGEVDELPDLSGAQLRLLRHGIPPRVVGHERMSRIVVGVVKLNHEQLPDFGVGEGDVGVRRPEDRRDGEVRFGGFVMLNDEFHHRESPGLGEAGIAVGVGSGARVVENDFLRGRIGEVHDGVDAL